MIEELIHVEINNKKYLPIDDLIEDLSKHLSTEIKYLAEEDKDGFEIAIHETIVYLRHYL